MAFAQAHANEGVARNPFEPKDYADLGARAEAARVEDAALWVKQPWAGGSAGPVECRHCLPKVCKSGWVVGAPIFDYSKRG